MELYNIFEKQHHLCPDFSKDEFEKLHDWEFGWALLETINIAESSDDDARISKMFSPGQKALYFFWYLDAEVTNGGFIQFYCNDRQRYLPPIIEGLKLIGDKDLLELIDKADQEYLTHKKEFDIELTKGQHIRFI